MTQNQWTIINIATICSCLTLLVLAVGAAIFFVVRASQKRGATPVKPPQQAVQPPPPVSRICTSCGTVNAPTNNFCEQCGAPLAK